MNFSIGLSGLRVAQQAIELIGTNIANAGTEGYHRQEPTITSQVLGSQQEGTIAGAKIDGVSRSYDLLLESKILSETPLQGELAQELEALEAVEGYLAEPAEGGLTTALTDFFAALRDLAAEPHSQPARQQLVLAAETMAGQFQSFAQFLSDLDGHIVTQAQTYAQEVNDLTARVAELNTQIESMELVGRNANLLKDQRDQALADLADLMGIRTRSRGDRPGVVDVSAFDSSIVVAGSSNRIETALTDDGKLSVRIEGVYQNHTSGDGGRLGGLLTLKNELLADLRDGLDALAAEIVQQVNQYHVHGVGTYGSFTELTGFVRQSDTTLESWNAGVSDGTVHLRLIDADGEIEHYSFDVDADADTLATIRDKINALPTADLEAEIAAGQLILRGLNDHKFDFLPTALVDDAGLTGSPPTVRTSGSYTGEADETYTATVVHPAGAGNAGEVGVTNGLQLEVTDSSGAVVARLDVGAGYAAGDRLTLAAGVEIALTPGELNHGESFEIEALTNHDETGLLVAAGLNVLLRGTGAADVAVDDAIVADPTRIATANDEEMLGNLNALRMAEVGETKLAALGRMDPSEYLRETITALGQNIAVRQSRKESIDAVLQQLGNQRDNFSGVDINDEAAKLLIFERMFQAAAKTISTQDRALQYLYEMT